jgi:hypothetical protein
MIKKTNMQRWFPSLIAAVALAGSTGLCLAQAPVINISFDTGVPPEFYDGGSPTNAGGSITNYWQATGGPDGSGCEVYMLDGVIDQEIDPAFNVSFNTSQYYLVTFQMKVDSSSGTVGTLGSGGYGNLQASFRDTSYSWNGVGYATIYPPAANAWVTYTYAVPSVPNMAHLQFQLQGGGPYSGPVTVYIGNVSILPVPNPLVLNAFTNSASVNVSSVSDGVNATWDSSVDAPYYDPVTGAGPTSITPAGSLEIQYPTPSGYQQFQLNDSFNPQLYQSVGFDVYYDGPAPGTTNDYGGFQMFIANGASPYNWAYIGNYSFTAADIGTWKHFTFPCASSGIGNAQGFALQSTPGSGAGTNPITFHMDNIQLWNPQTHPTITSFTQNTTPGGVKIAVDADGTANQYDQEGFCSPSGDNSGTNFFWIGQYPATYSFTITNFPAPAAAPGFDAHVYIVNGDTLASGDTGGFGYNQTYSGVNYNAYDMISLDIQNGNITNGGVVAIFGWKTNAPSSNISTNNGGLITCALTNLTSANGTWSLNFSDNTHGTIVGPNGSVVTNFTMPDLSGDGNFTPATSLIQFGVFKNDVNNTGVNNNQSTVFTHVMVTNSVLGTIYNDSFGGPGLTANYAWQVAEYYQYAANRTTWIPAGTAYWMTWNTTQTGFEVISSTNLAGTWSDAGVTYTYPDGTGTNTIGAVPAASLPPGNADFFELQK